MAIGGWDEDKLDGSRFGTDQRTFHLEVDITQAISKQKREELEAG